MALGLKVSPDVSASFTGLYLVGLLGGGDLPRKQETSKGPCEL